MSEQSIESGYSGFSYGEVTSHSDKKEGQHISGLSTRTANGRVFDDNVRPGTTELGFTPHFHKKTPFLPAQINALNTGLQAKFTQEGLNPEVKITQREDRTGGHILGITFYVPVTDKAKLENVINDIDSTAKGISIPFDDMAEAIQKACDTNNYISPARHDDVTAPSVPQEAKANCAKR